LISLINNIHVGYTRTPGRQLWFCWHNKACMWGTWCNDMVFPLWCYCACKLSRPVGTDRLSLHCCKISGKTIYVVIQASITEIWPFNTLQWP